MWANRIRSKLLPASSYVLGLAILAGAAPLAGDAQQASLHDQLEEVVREHVAAGFRQAGLEGELVAIHLPANVAHMSAAAAIKPLRTFTPREAAGRYVIPLEITSPGGKIMKLNATAECVAVVHGWAVRLPTKRGTRLDKKDFERKTIRVTRREKEFFTDGELPANFQLTTHLAAGNFLRMHHLEMIPVVQRGEQVEIHFRRQSITLISPGKARRKGNIGDTIPVVASVTGKRLYGRLVAPGKVVVE